MFQNQSNTNHLPPPLPPKPGSYRRPSPQIDLNQRVQQNQNMQQLPEMLMNYSESSIVDRFANDDGSLEQQMAQFSQQMVMSEEEEMAAMGKNAFMPRQQMQFPTSTQYDQRQVDNFSRQPDFESIHESDNRTVKSQDASQMMVQQPNSGRQINESGFSEQRGGQAQPGKVADNLDGVSMQDQWQTIIDWVNSFNHESCLIVSGFADFYDGVALCHLVAQIACNQQDQSQMSQLIHIEHDNDPSKMIQNFELALNVFQASTLSLPESIQTMRAVDIQSSQVHCFMFLETLRQANTMGIIKQLEQGSPIKRQHSQMTNESLEYNDVTLQQSPLELKSSKKTDRMDSGLIQEQRKEETPSQSIKIVGQNIPVDKSVHEVVHMDTTTESQDKMQNLSPTFQPDNLRELNEQAVIPLQMSTSSNQNKDTSAVKKKKQQKSSSNVTPISSSRDRKTSNGRLYKSNSGTPLTSNSKKQLQQVKHPRTTQHTQDSSYKPLFTDSVSQRKKLQEMQLQVQNYDRVIRNSYDRLTASNQVLANQSVQITPGVTPIKATASATPLRTPNNADLQDVAIVDLARLDRQIEQEQDEIARQMPFGDVVEKQQSITADSPPRMDSPKHPMDQNSESEPKPAGVDEIEQIMLQLQTLQVEKNEVQVHPVDEKTKLRVLRWLVDDVKLINAQLSVPKLLADLPKYCRNGVLFGDLINRLRGREEVIKGLHRTPKNMTAIAANFEKVLTYLKQFPRFSSRYLWAHDKVIEGNSDVIWGLLDDTWHWHFNKLSAHDPANTETRMIRSSSHQEVRQGPTSNVNQSIQSRDINDLKSASSQRVKVPEVVIGTGPPKMRDYLRNGEKARSSLAQSSNNDTMNHRSGRQSAHSNSDSNRISHNFKPDKSLKKQQQTVQDNYHSFGNIELEQEAKTGEQMTANKRHRMSHEPEMVQPRTNSELMAPSSISKHQQKDRQTNHHTIKTLRPPKAPTSQQQQPQQTMPLQLTNLSTISSAINPSSQPAKNKKAFNFEQVPRLNAEMFGQANSQQQQYNGGNVSARSRPEENGPRGANRYSVIQSVRSSMTKQWESPRSYGSSKKYHQMIPPSPMQRQSRQTSQSKGIVHMQGPVQNMVASGNHFRSLDSTRMHQSRAKYEPRDGTTKDQIIDEWLTFLKFHPFMSAEFEYGGPTEDPKRNGIFISELTAYLLPQSAQARQLAAEGRMIIQRPKNVVECQRNWSHLFSVLLQLLKQSSSVRMLSRQTIQLLMQGDRSTLYKLLHCIYESFYARTDLLPQATGCQSSMDGSSIGSSLPVVAPLLAPVEISRRRMTPSHSASVISSSHTNNFHQQALVPSSDKDQTLPYTPDELTQLDLSIIHWLKEIGQLKALSVDFAHVDSILDLQRVLSNGVLLCALVSRVFKTRITGVFKDPKTETTSLSNLRKAMKVLQTSRKMSQKFTWTEKQVYECQRSIVLGLLEDIHRAYDGLAPRKRGSGYFDDGPYLGARFVEHYNQQHQMLSMAQQLEDTAYHHRDQQQQHNQL